MMWEECLIAEQGFTVSGKLLLSFCLTFVQGGQLYIAGDAKCIRRSFCPHGAYN